MRQTLEFSPPEASAFSRKPDSHGETREICSEAKVADTFAGDEVEIATETVAGCALGCGERLEGRAIKMLCVNTNDSAEDIGAMVKDH